MHLELSIDDLPVKYRLLKLDAPDDLLVEHAALHDLPEGWVARHDITRALGDAWLGSLRSPLMRVPSALVPETFNVLLNPIHPDAGRITVAQTTEHPFDPRLLA